jgi:hypothetical protein
MVADSLRRRLQILNLAKKYGNDEQFSIEIKSKMALSYLNSEEILVYVDVKNNNLYCL